MARIKIIIEGEPGSGKTMVRALLAEYLNTCGLRVETEEIKKPNVDRVGVLQVMKTEITMVEREPEREHRSYMASAGDGEAD